MPGAIRREEKREEKSRGSREEKIMEEKGRRGKGKIGGEEKRGEGGAPIKVFTRTCARVSGNRGEKRG